MSLRDRCKEFYSQMQRNGMLRQGSPVDDLMAFVIAEKGRTGDPALEESLPLCLYFGSQEDRDGFMEIVREVKPGMIAKPLP